MNDNLINDKYIIDSTHKIQYVILNEINIKLLEILIYFIWHLEKKVKADYNPEISLKVIKNYFNRAILEISDDNFNYIELELYKNISKYNVNIDNCLYKQLYELTLI